MPKNLIILIVSVGFAIILWGSISLSEIYYADFDANLKLIQFPSGYTTGTELPRQISIKVRSQGWKLFQLNIGSDAEFNVTVGADSGRKFINLYNHLVNNQWIQSDMEIIDISPDTLSFYVERIHSKKVPVIPDLDLNFRPGYGIAAAIHYAPDSVRISGPASKVRDIDKIYSTSVSLSSLDKKTMQTVPLPRLYGIEYSEQVIRITLDVQRIVDKLFEEINVEVVNVPPNRDVVLLPNKISCNIRGGIDFLGKMKSDQLRAYIYYNDILTDSVGSVIPTIELPENTVLQFIRPERLRYIIKAF